MKRRNLLKLSTAALLAPALPLSAQEAAPATLDPALRDAYIYAYPVVKNYLTMYQYAVETGGGQYKGPFNETVSIARVYTPEDTAIITPNSDTPYSFVVLDLRAEPVVATLPPIEANRYYSLQLVDLYTNNVDYPGTRVDGNGGGNFLITGPGWTGTVPEGITRVIEMPTWLGLGVVRTQLFSPEDLPAVESIQAQITSKPLSAWAGTEAPAPAPEVTWMPISDAAMSTDFWDLAAFLLPFAPAWPSDGPMRDALAKFGIDGVSGTWQKDTLDPALVSQMQAAVDPLYDELRATAAGLTDSSKLFGTPAQMEGKYIERAAAAQGGIYGNSVEEALYIIYVFDSANAALDGSQQAYRLTFAADALPPVDAFWSLTMYDRESQLLIENPLQRYLINSTMLDGLKRDEAGNVVIYMQATSPGPELEANWLPAPAATFYGVLRLYLPQATAIEGKWTPPSITSAAL